MLPLHLHDQLESSKSTRSKLKEKVAGLFRFIFSDKNSRNLFSFLLLNLSFAIVELLYGVWTNSLGLISDSFHMFFDCTALLAGLAATVVSRLAPPPLFLFPYPSPPVSFFYLVPPLPPPICPPFLGSGPDRGHSPVEWGDFPYVRPYVRSSVRPPLKGGV